MKDSLTPVLKNWLDYADYEVDDALERIEYLVACGRITAEDAKEFTVIAKERGTPSMTKEEKITALEAELKALKEG